MPCLCQQARAQANYHGCAAAPSKQAARRMRGMQLPPHQPPPPPPPARQPARQRACLLAQLLPACIRVQLQVQGGGSHVEHAQHGAQHHQPQQRHFQVRTRAAAGGDAALAVQPRHAWPPLAAAMLALSGRCRSSLNEQRGRRRSLGALARQYPTHAQRLHLSASSPGPSCLLLQQGCATNRTADALRLVLGGSDLKGLSPPSRFL